MQKPTGEISWHEKLSSLFQVARYRPGFTVGIVVLGGFVAVFEGIGLSFIYPIMEVAQSDGPIQASDPIMQGFLSIYQFLGVPFLLSYLMIGISLVMVIRFTSSFLVGWLRGMLQKLYEEKLRTQAFLSALNAEVRYFDQEGSDDILNAIITETRYSGRVIREAVLSMETSFLILVYLSVMVYIAPGMTVIAILLLGGITFILRHILEPAYTVGTRVAEANEEVQRIVQAGTQGIRDVKLFGLIDELFDDFSQSIRQYTRSSVDLTRNKAALRNLYDLTAALSLFALIYIGFVFSDLSLGALGIFLFAMFRLSPLMSRLNSQVYSMEGDLSHLVRTQEFVQTLRERNEERGSLPVNEIEGIAFDDVSFTYTTGEKVLKDLSFQFEKGEFIGFVGQSGAGKSTIVSLLARLYEPDSGGIRANGTPISEFDLDDWRSRIAYVRQDPFIFNDTLENNLTIGRRDATREEIDRVVEISKVDEFMDDLPKGYDSKLGDDGVRLSGGQRQRVALARALLRDADVLVLDEATSDLDSNLEREVQAAIESMDREYGIIAIAHRLSTVKNANRIYVVENGEISETGTHPELLQQQGKYEELYSIQSKT